ncbi:MarR family transcriptional regulator [Desulfovibrio sp. OttesenSCG-928-I05]|nr:MarR family transcriptional regulator [Desulfovibrio sp. OttesenSCG-928-I05]
MDSRLYSPEGRLVAEINFEIFKINGLLLQGGDQMIKSTSLTIARWLMLLALEEMPITVAQASRLVGIRRQSAQRLVDALVEMDLVEFKPNRNHRRAMLACLTEAGKEKLCQAQSVHSAAANSLADGMEPEMLQQALSVLQNIHLRLREKAREKLGSGERELNKTIMYHPVSEDLENKLRQRSKSCGIS